MRYKLFIAGTLAITALACLPDRALAQRSITDEILDGPRVSPYLNLLRGGGSGVPTYYTLVRPQIAQRQENIRQQAEIQRLRTRINNPRRSAESVAGTGISTDIRGTGHITYYQNYSHYYTMPDPNNQRR